MHYERRPSLWVEPLGDWGEGAVQLVELPTDDETMDNIVATWVPKHPAKAGSSLKLKYRLTWSAGEPHETALARCIATRTGPRRRARPGSLAGHWRAEFDFSASGTEVVDMRLFLKVGEQTLSETWLYQYHVSLDHFSRSMAYSMEKRGIFF